METTSVISLMPQGKAELDDFILKTVNLVKSGAYNPLLLASQLKYIELSLDGIREGIQDELLKEHAKYGEKTIKYHGFEISQAEVGTSYDYSNCNDSKLEAIQATIESLKHQEKKRKDFLRSIQGHLQEVDDEGVVTITTPPIKSSKTSLKFKLV